MKKRILFILAMFLAITLAHSDVYLTHTWAEIETNMDYVDDISPKILWQDGLLTLTDGGYTRNWQIIGASLAESIADGTSAGDATLTKTGENFLTTVSIGDAVVIYAGTTAADYGLYIVASVDSDEQITLDRSLSGSDTDVYFHILADGAIIENSTDGSNKAIIRLPGDIYVDNNIVAYSGGAFHDGFSDFVANEHIDWTQDQGTTNIHSGNYTDTNTTYTAGTGLSLVGTQFSSTITQYADADAIAAIKGDGDWNASNWDTAYGWGDHSGEGYLTAEVDGSTTNEINTITGDDANATTGLGITLAGGSDISTSVSGDVVTIAFTGSDTQLTEEEVEDYVGEMVTGNTETRITVTYQDDDGTIDFVVDAETDPVFGSHAANSISSGDITNLGNLSGTNSGDQTSMSGISDTKADFNTSLSDGSFAFDGGAHHDGFSDFVANEHIDWTAASAGTIHSSNYVDNNTTYTSSDFNHDDLTGVTANEHIDWTQDQGTTNIHSGNYTDTNTEYTAGTGLDLTGTVFSSTITQYADADAIAAIKGDGDWNASNWDTAYGWGDHSGEGYLTAEVDGSTTNEINTITGDDANATAGLGTGRWQRYINFRIWRCCNYSFYWF